VLPGRVVHRRGTRRTVDVGDHGSRGDLHDSAGEPDVSVHLCARLCVDPRNRDVRVYRRLHHGLRQRGCHRLRHGLLLPALHLSGTDSHLLPVSVFVRRRDLLQFDDGCLEAGRRDLRSVWRRSGAG
jgi:hypothetical protein